MSIKLLTMAISWAQNVNKKILDSTQITIGEGGYVEDKSANGEFEERRLTSLAVPDTFNVVMDFNWLEKDEYGQSEFDRFVNWYKYVHKRGTKPFWFDTITDFDINGAINKINPVTKEESKCQYKITSSLKPVKSGFCYRVTMTWKEVYSGAGILVQQNEIVPDRMTVDNGHIQLYFNHKPIVDPDHPAPSKEDFKLYIKEVNETEYLLENITSVELDGSCENIYFNEIENPGTYFIKVVYKTYPLTDGLEVQ